jgi:hypothetical protein
MSILSASKAIYLGKLSRRVLSLHVRNLHIDIQPLTTCKDRYLYHQYLSEV